MLIDIFQQDPDDRPTIKQLELQLCAILQGKPADLGDIIRDDIQLANKACIHVSVVNTPFSADTTSASHSFSCVLLLAQQNSD